jgi:hypothetical protein
MNSPQSNTAMQKYLLKILEIPGKSVTQQYIAILRDKLDKQGLKYSIRIVVDENLLENMQSENIQTGGASTFPFNVVENLFERLFHSKQKEKDWITHTYDKLEEHKTERRGIFDRLFSYTPTEVEPTTTPLLETLSGDTTQFEQPEIISDEPIEFPVGFTGVIHIEVSVYNPPNGSNKLTLGLLEMNIII